MSLVLRAPFLEVVRSTSTLCLGQRFALRADRAPTKIGSARDNDVSFDSWDPSFALHHAVIERRAGVGGVDAWWLRSTAQDATATTVNREPVRYVEIHEGDELRIADVIFAFRVAGASVVTGVTRAGDDWIGFAPVSRIEMYAAPRREPFAVETLWFDGALVVDEPGFPTLRARVDGGVVLADCAGVALDEWRAVARAQGVDDAERARLRLAFDEAQLVLARGAPFTLYVRERRATFRGALVTFTEQSTAIRLSWERWWRAFVDGLADDLAGHKEAAPSSVELLRAHAGAGRYERVVEALEAMARDAPTADEVRAAVAGLFPERAQAHERLHEEVAVLGVDGLVRLAGT